MRSEWWFLSAEFCFGKYPLSFQHPMALVSSQPIWEVDYEPFLTPRTTNKFDLVPQTINNKPQTEESLLCSSADT